MAGTMGGIGSSRYITNDYPGLIASEVGLADTYYKRVKDLSTDRLERLYRMNNVRYHCVRHTRNAGILRALRERNAQVEN